MQRYHVFVKLVDESDKPVTNARLTVQHFLIAQGTWRRAGGIVTNSKGTAERIINFNSTGAAPMLRLIEAGNPTRVLSHGGKVLYDKTKRTLFVDFGTIERLDDQAYSFTGEMTQTRTVNENVAGVPNRPEVRFTAMSRVVAGSPIMANMVMADAQRTASSNTAIQPAQLKALSTQIQGLQVRENDLNRQLVQKDTVLREKDSQLNLRITEVNTLKGRIATHDREKQDLIRAHALDRDKLTARLNKEKLEEIAKIQQEKKAAEDRAASLEQQVQKQVGVDDLAANIGTQVQAAQSKLSTSKTPFRVGRVEVNLKALVQNQGRSLSLPDAADIKDASVGGRLADVKLEFQPGLGPDEDEATTQTPDLNELTETAARRVLLAAGLRMETAYGTPTRANIATGQAFKQSPAKGTPLAKGQTVIVVFAT